MAERLTPADMPTLIRSAAMAPLAPDTVRQLLEEHGELLAQQADLENLLRRLLPAWGEVRALLNELAARVDSAPG